MESNSSESDNENNNNNEYSNNSSLHNIPQENLISYLRQNIFMDVQVNDTQIEQRNYQQITANEGEITNTNNHISDNNDNQFNESYTNNSQSSEYTYESVHSSEHEDNINNNLEYFEYSLYPINIDWKEVENYENNYFEIYNVFGNFGISTFILLSNINLELKYNDYIFSIFNFYYENYCNENYDNLNLLYNNLPTLESIKIIFDKKMFNSKEFIIFKIVLDLYEKFLVDFNENLIFSFQEKFNFKEQFSNFINVSFKFYFEILKSNDLQNIYDTISIDMQRTYDIYKIMKCPIYKNKKEYMKHFKKLKRKYDEIVKGINIQMFII